MCKVGVRVFISMCEGEKAYELTWQEAEQLYDSLRVVLKKDQNKQPYAPTIQPRWDPPPMYKDPWVYPIITCKSNREECSAWGA